MLTTPIPADGDIQYISDISPWVVHQHLIHHEALTQLLARPYWPRKLCEIIWLVWSSNWIVNRSQTKVLFASEGQPPVAGTWVRFPVCLMLTWPVWPESTAQARPMLGIWAGGWWWSRWTKAQLWGVTMPLTITDDCNGPLLRRRRVETNAQPSDPRPGRPPSPPLTLLSGNLCVNLLITLTCEHYWLLGTTYYLKWADWITFLSLRSPLLYFCENYDAALSSISKRCQPRK